MAEKTCMITGASRGIGLATALRFAQGGYDVVIAARHAETLQAAAERVAATGAKCIPVIADVGTRAGAEAIIAAGVQHFGRVDVLVNNAGFAVLRPIDQTDPADMETSFAINCHGVFHTTRAVWPVMTRQGGGVIVNLSSVASIDPFPGFSVYGACKAWVNIFSKATADEGKKLGIRVYAIAPGAVETQMLRGVLPDLAAEYVLDPADVAAAIEAVCDERMRTTAGQTIFVRK